MKNKLIVALLALGLGLTALAADTSKSDEPKPPMYSAHCKSPCSFSVKSHDRAEVVAILQEHAKAHHNGLALSETDAEGMIKTVEPRK